MRRKPLIEREKKRRVREVNDLPNSHHIKTIGKNSHITMFVYFNKCFVFYIQNISDVPSWCKDKQDSFTDPLLLNSEFDSRWMPCIANFSHALPVVKDTGK